MLEAAVVLGRAGEALYWHLPLDRTGARLPDSRPLWDVLWELRDQVGGVAHSHPGRGVPMPSRTDVTTFDSIELGLDQRLDWWIASEDHLALFRWRRGPDPYNYEIKDIGSYPERNRFFPDPPWLERLRRESVYRTTSHPKGR